MPRSSTLVGGLVSMTAIRNGPYARGWLSNPSSTLTAGSSLVQCCRRAPVCIVLSSIYDIYHPYCFSWNRDIYQIKQNKYIFVFHGTADCTDPKRIPLMCKGTLWNPLGSITNIKAFSETSKMATTKNRFPKENQFAIPCVLQWYKHSQWYFELQYL